MVDQKNKELIVNADYEYYASKRPICYASNNSESSFCDYVMKSNCEWQVAFEYDDSNRPFDFDVDFLCIAKRDGCVPDDCEDVVFWNNISSANHGIQMMGDSIGDACPPNEIFWIDFNNINSSVVQIDFLITLFAAEEQGIDFSLINKLRMRIEGDKDDMLFEMRANVVFQYDLVMFPHKHTVVKLGSLMKEKCGWSYKPVVEGFEMNLIEVVRTYGFDV